MSTQSPLVLAPELLDRLAGPDGYAQEQARRVLLGRGAAADRVWTCDLSHDYVTINADYRS